MVMYSSLLIIYNLSYMVCSRLWIQRWYMDLTNHGCVKLEGLPSDMPTWRSLVSRRSEWEEAGGADPRCLFLTIAPLDTCLLDFRSIHTLSLVNVAVRAPSSNQHGSSLTGSRSRVRGGRT